MLHVLLAKCFPYATCLRSSDETTLILSADELLSTMKTLRNHEDLHFCQLTDVTAVDYLLYKVGDWDGRDASSHGFSRARCEMTEGSLLDGHRYAVVYQLLSHRNKWRVRIRVLLSGGALELPSVSSLWPSANWSEREVYDLFGIVFTDHPDLQRILTDYDFVGHPLRKDFPTAGTYELRYDADAQAVVSEPSEHFARVEVGKVVRLEEIDGR